MILIDKPYISDFFIKTIKDKNFPIVATPLALEMLDDNNLNWIDEKEAKKRKENNPSSALYTNSENTISWIDKNVDLPELHQQIQLFKNKTKFRELLSESYPNYFFKGILARDLRNVDLGELKFPFFIKPAVGFFSIAVHRVNTVEDWYRVLDLIEDEIEKTKDLYPDEVINTNDFILEEFIPGKEYAVDCYFDKTGSPVILNILHHIFSSEKDVSDRIYSSSKKIIEENIELIQTFLNILGDKAKLQNFPMHVELRIDSEGNIIPIEVNPLRFGGFCTTGDLTWYAYGINSYEYFFNSKKPDWREIFKTREEKKYSIVVLDNNSGYKESEIERFDFELLAKDFKKPLDIRKIDFKKYLTFGFVLLETEPDNEKELEQILGSDLRKYIRLR